MRRPVLSSKKTEFASEMEFENQIAIPGFLCIINSTSPKDNRIEKMPFSKSNDPDEWSDTRIVNFLLRR